ncbi:MAG: hypothetical protein ACI8W8_001111 [Rhodothermales bacterium]|jgi:hypothetical protein
MGNIQTKDGRLPLATQRSDKWSNADLLKALTGKDAKDPGLLDRGESRELSEALVSEDQLRLLAEARALLEQAQESAKAK